MATASQSLVRQRVWADTPVTIRTTQTISSAMLHVGQDVDIQAIDAVWAGKAIVIPIATPGIANITAIHKFPFRPIQIEIGLMFIRAASGERVPPRCGQPLAGWKITLPHGFLPIGTGTITHVSRASSRIVGFELTHTPKRPE
jgi:hypothetical protein